MSKPVLESLCLRTLRPRPNTLKLHQITQARAISQSPASLATVVPITATGPPPSPPEPTSTSPYGARVEERRRKAALIQQGKDIRAAQQGKPSPLRKRFWNHVHVKETSDGAASGYQVLLDTRPVRTPNKAILTIPKSKPNLAYAIAIEWDFLTSAQQALKNHKIPMTSIMSRAQDIVDAELKGDMRIREEILRTMMRYLDTDTLLCWAPAGTSDTALDMYKAPNANATDKTLRDVQKEAAEQIISYLNTTVWPGVEIKPVLEDGTIMPSKQDEVTKQIISGWIWGLSAFDLAGLERAALATKSLLVATRLLIEWSEDFRDVQRSAETRFGIEEAALAATIEVRWQTGVWGEVEDTHDVENEDIRRQLGSAILLIAGSR